MLPEPLHPAVVHFPIVFATLLPIAAVAALIAIRRGARTQLAWGVVVALAAALAVSAFVATETGEDQEERVETVVPHRAFERHEEAGERFRTFASVVMVLVACGIVGGRTGNVLRIAGAAAALALLVLAWQVGESGGDLVYEHGAARAYQQDPFPPGATPPGATPPGERSSDTLKPEEEPRGSIYDS